MKSGAKKFGPTSSAKTTSSLNAAKLKSARSAVDRSSSVLETSQRKIQVALEECSVSLAASMASFADNASSTMIVVTSSMETS